MADATDTAGATSAADTTTATPPTKQPCWSDDPDYPDDYSKIDLAPDELFNAYFIARIFDSEDEPQHRIIDADDRFKVRFRVALQGDLDSDISGDWWFDLGFTPTGAGTGFDLSDLLGSEKFYVRDWPGLQANCIELIVEVPRNTLPTEYVGTVYRCASKVQLFRGGRPTAVVGFDELGAFQFYKASIEE